MTQPPWSPYVLFENAVPTWLCDRIIDYHSDLEYYSAGVTTDSDPVESVRSRKTDIQGSALEWLNSMILGYLRKANVMNFNYDLTDHDKEFMQFAKYTEGMFFKDHMDYGVHRDQLPFTRKLSLTLQLSNPADYKGGELIIYNCNSGDYTCPKSQGSIVVFDSRWVHEVLPVKSGTRYSMVKWIHGDTHLR